MRKHLLVFMAVLFSISAIYAQRTVTGTITDNDGELLIGASLIVVGTQLGTITDVDGTFKLEIAEDVKEPVLEISYTGYTTQTIPLGASNIIDVVLDEGVTLDVVTVNALGLVVDRDKQGSARSTVGGESLVSSGETSALQALAGKSSSVTITRSGGDPGSGAYIQIRGQNTITGNTQPLIVVDGMPIFNSSFGDGRVNTVNQTGGVVQQSRFNDINPDDIESVEILKGAAAAALWGTRAANGVVVVTTKKGKMGTNKKFNVNFRSSASIDQINVEHPLQNTYGQGIGGQWVANRGESWGDKIADRPGGEDFVIDEAGTYFDADGGDLYSGYFEAEDGTKYYNIPNAGLSVFDANGDMVYDGDNNYGGKRSTNTFLDQNQDQVFRTGVGYNNSLSIDGGTLNTTYFMSVSNLNQKGIIEGNSDYDRTTFRVNVGNRFTDYLKLNVNASYSHSNSNRIQTGSNLSGLYLGYLRTASDFDNSDFKGTYFNASGVPTLNSHRGYRNRLGTSSPAYNNPGWTINEQINTSRVDRYIFAPELSIDPTAWWNITARVGIDNYVDNRHTYFPVNSAGSGSAGANRDEFYTENQVNADIFTRFTRKLSNAISMNALVGLNINDRKFKYLEAEIFGFTIPNAPPETVVNSSSENSSVTNFIRNIRSTAGYFTLGFDMYDMINLQFTGRREVASTFLDGIFYPSASLAWQFTKLNGLKANEALSFGKLRASYGTVGIQPDPYLSSTDFISAFIQESWSPSLDASLFGGSFVRSDIQGNPNLVPERKTEFEIGTDLRFVNDRIGLSLTYYQNKVDNAIFAVDVPPSTGFESKYENAALIENKGFEIDVDADVIKSKNFVWNVFANWSTNRNEVVDLKGVESIFLNGFTGTSARAVEGQPLSALWGGRWDRNDAGDLLLDENGFPQQALEEGIIGDANPDWRGSLGSAITWKGVNFSFLFETMQGNQMWGGTRGVLYHFGRHPDTAEEVVHSTDLVESNGNVIPAGTPFRGQVKDFGAGEVALTEPWFRGGLGSGFGPVAEQFIYDASWTRLREVGISYRLTSNGFKNKTKLDWIEIGFTARNVLLWTDFDGQDPDMNLSGASNGRGLDYFSNPGTKSFIINVKINY